MAAVLTNTLKAALVIGLLCLGVAALIAATGTS
jgi:hypothetical protein